VAKVSLNALARGADPRSVEQLGQALLFDMAIQHGPAHKYTQTAEQQLGAPPKSKLGENGLTEEQLIDQVAQVRKNFLYAFAASNNFPGIKKRPFRGRSGSLGRLAASR
jgi:hypothetical protein